MRRIVMACVISATATFARAQPAPEEVEVPAQADQYSDTDPSALSDFRAPLAPYGSWVDDPTYGTVWIPHRTVVGDAFVPYQTAGHWAMDGANYVWLSDYSWGWLPFHYGRWVFIDGTGWAWIPGRAYAPSWVDWSVGDDYDYVGWYPTPPDFIWWGGVAIGLAVTPAVDFFYCPTPFLFDKNVARHVIAGAEARRIALHARTLPAVVTTRRGAFERGFVRGPAVSRLGKIRVVQAHPDQRELVLARRYATPARARAAGATPPSAHRVKVPVTRVREGTPRPTTPRETAPGPTTPRTPTPVPRAPKPVPTETIPGVPEPSTPMPEKAPTTPNHPAPLHIPPPIQSSPSRSRSAPPIMRAPPESRSEAPSQSAPPSSPPPTRSEPPIHSTTPPSPPPTHSEPPIHSAPPPSPPIHTAPPPSPPIHSAPPPSPPAHRAPASEAPAPSAPAPTPPRSPSSPAPSSSEPGVFDSAAGIAGLFDTPSRLRGRTGGASSTASCG